jgi:hypothetical protein
MSQLPAYQGAPYRQPRPPSRQRRALRVFVRAVIAVAVLSLFIIIGALLVHAGAP